MSAPRLPIRFNEAFFDAVFRRLAWEKIRRNQGHAPGGESADYAGDGYVLELKHLRTNSLEEDDPKGLSRKLKFLEFQTEQYRAGNLVADWVNGMARPLPERRQEYNQALWTLHFGNSLRNSLEKADGQIANTRRLRPGNTLRGAVFVVNEAFEVLSCTGLANLLVHYLQEQLPQEPARRRLENTDVAFGFCVRPEWVDAPQPGYAQPLICAGPSKPNAADDELQKRFHDAISAELKSRGVSAVGLGEIAPSALRPGQREQVVSMDPRPMRIKVDDSASDLESGFSGVVKRTWAKAKAYADAKAGQETRRCHYTPRFLLAKWAGADGNIRVRNLKTGVETVRSPKEVAIRFDLYSRLEPSGTPERRFLEKFFQIIEEAAAGVLAMPLFYYPKGEVGGTPELSPRSRQVLALFVALQLVRLPTVIDQLTDEWKPDWKGEWGRMGDGRAHPGNFLYRLLGAEEPFDGYGSWFAGLAQTLHDKRWAVLYSELPGPRIQTGDIPVRIATRMGVPISKDPKLWAIQMPLSPSSVLVLDDLISFTRPVPEGCHRLPASEVPWKWDAPGLEELIL